MSSRAPFSPATIQPGAGTRVVNLVSHLAALESFSLGLFISLLWNPVESFLIVGCFTMDT